MQLFIRGQSVNVLNVFGNESVADIKPKICEWEKSDEVRLYVNGSPLADSTFLSELENHACIDVTVPLFGGKVHGSLARAGKVKGQTPKVDAQEKKKKKTGRCKRRLQYNRRFVNAVQSFGRKKGPNSNS